MSTIECRYCSSSNYEERPHPMHGAGLWCSCCGRWIKWLGKARTPEQIAERQAAQKIYQQEYMAQQDPTQAQLDYLHRLGYRGPVSSRLHASMLIDNLTKHGGRCR